MDHHHTVSALPLTHDMDLNAARDDIANRIANRREKQLELFRENYRHVNTVSNTVTGSDAVDEREREYSKICAC